MEKDGETAGESRHPDRNRYGSIRRILSGIPNEKGTGYCLAQAGGDVRALTKALNAALNGRGGGKPGICQGSCAAEPEQVKEFLRKTK